MFFQINPKRFSTQLDELTKNNTIINSSYLISYQYFIGYFKALKTIEEKNVVLGAHFVYGWMPTILHLDSEKIGEVAGLLNKAKRNEPLSGEEIDTIKSCINNSLVGTSKLLHFVNPTSFAIWDRNIMAYFSPNKNAYGIDKRKYYLQYLEALKAFAATPVFKQLKPQIVKLCGPVSDLRAIEFILFESIRLKKSKHKSLPQQPA